MPIMRRRLRKASQSVSRVSEWHTAFDPLGKSCILQTKSRATCWDRRVALSKGGGVEIISPGSHLQLPQSTEKAASETEPRAEHRQCPAFKCVSRK